MVGSEVHEDLLGGGELLVVVDLDAHLERPHPDLTVEEIAEIDGIDDFALHQVGRVGGTLGVEVEIFGPEAEDDALAR